MQKDSGGAEGLCAERKGLVNLGGRRMSVTTREPNGSKLWTVQSVVVYEVCLPHICTSSSSRHLISSLIPEETGHTAGTDCLCPATESKVSELSLQEVLSTENQLPARFLFAYFTASAVE